MLTSQGQKCIQMHIKTKTRRYQTDGQAGSSWPHLWPWSWPRSECVAVIRATVGRCGQSHGHCQNMWLKSWPQSEHPLLVLVKYPGCGRVFRNSIPDNVAMLLNIKPLAHSTITPLLVKLPGRGWICQPAVKWGIWPKTLCCSRNIFTILANLLQTVWYHYNI
jgi:hypothetical protein